MYFIVVFFCIIDGNDIIGLLHYSLKYLAKEWSVLLSKPDILLGRLEINKEKAFDYFPFS